VKQQPKGPASGSRNPLDAAAVAPATSAKPKAPIGRSGASGPIRTLGDLRSEEEEEESSVDRNNYFAGGGRTGEMIQDPNKRTGPDFVKEMFEAAKARGAQVVDEAEERAKKSTGAFEGIGYRLGSSPYAPTMPDPETVKRKKEAERQAPQRLVITFWRQGFTVDDSPLRRFEDPANREFLDDIHKGVVPRELERTVRGRPLDVSLVDRSHEDYVPPKPVLKPFTGQGHTLGSSPAPSQPAPATSAGSAWAFSLDETQPITTLQLRLADGTRLVARFNHTHTLRDVRAFLDASRPNQRPYDLQTPLPAQTLTELDKSLKDLGLLNATIVQRPK
jgi:UBX domain-containing protein 1